MLLSTTGGDHHVGIDTNTQEVRIICHACHLRIVVQDEVHFSFITGGLIQTQCLDHGKNTQPKSIIMFVALNHISYEILSKLQCIIESILFIIWHAYYIE